MAVNILNGNSVIIFYYQGKTMIGRIYLPSDTAVENYPSVAKDKGNIIPEFLTDQKIDNEYYIIANPCAIDFTIKKPNTGSATLEWTLTPFFYKALLSESFRVVAAFPRSEVTLSSIADGYINGSLRSAWEQLCGTDE